METNASTETVSYGPIADEFGPDLEEAKNDPEFRAAFEDADELQRLIDTLVHHRKALGLSQKDVAVRMGVRQPTISGFENEGSDPRISTLQRYARAVEARLRLRIQVPSECDWVSNSMSTYLAPKAPKPAALQIKSGGSRSVGWSGDASRGVWRRAS